MTGARTAGLALAVLVAASTAGCGDDDTGPGDGEASYQPGIVRFEEVDLQLRVPAELADLTYSVGEFEGSQPTLDFSTERLAEAGGPTCAAGATAAVSPYPIGQVIVSTETPRQIREEAAENPEEGLGTFVRKVGDRYLYYVAPPAEGCTTEGKAAAELQQELTVALREAVRGMRPMEGGS